STPARDWTATVTATYGDASPRSPVLDKSGEVLVADGAAIDVLRDGAFYQSLNLDNLSYGTPAIAADGTVYALDVAGNLYAFPYSTAWLKYGNPANSSSASKDAFSEPKRYRRWKLNL